MDLGNTIKNFRKQKELKQGEFAIKCGISQTYLSLIENNQKEPNLSTLKEISIQLDIPLPIIFFQSMTNEDIPSQKRDAYKIIGPSVKSLINEFFSIQ
jgi:transcriptional regulator with XRE-family HTH domain